MIKTWLWCSLFALFCDQDDFMRSRKGIKLEHSKCATLWTAWLYSNTQHLYSLIFYQLKGLIMIQFLLMGMLQWNQHLAWCWAKQMLLNQKGWFVGNVVMHPHAWYHFGQAFRKKMRKDCARSAKNLSSSKSTKAINQSHCWPSLPLVVQALCICIIRKGNFVL